MPDFVSALLGSLGADVTPQNTRFLSAWIRAEGTKAANNPLATTQVAPGATSFNSVGVRNYPDLQSGVAATSKTLLNGRYGPIVSGLRSGASADQLAQAVAASPWGTGSGVLRVLGSKGAAVPATPAPPSPSLPSPTVMPAAPPDLSGALIGSMGQSPGAQLQALMGALAAAPRAPMPAAATPMPSPATVPSGSAPPGKGGSPVPARMLSSIGGEHETAGLPGFPARDYMAKAGTPVLAPVGGKIVRLSGHDPRNGPVDGVHGPFGWSLYLQGDDGRTYYMTHLGSRDVTAGQKVPPGSVLGTVGDYAHWGGADHVHMGVR